jgi:CubicO group peptidase (beta-lactamase class C family)
MAIHKYENNGLSKERLNYLVQVIEDDIQRGRYHGASIMVAREGKIGLHKGIGFSHLSTGRKAQTDDIFTIFSMSKAFTNVLTFRAIEQGRFALTTRIAEIIPEFSGGLRESITFNNLLTHTLGIPPILSPIEGMNLDILADIIDAIAKNVHCTEQPGKTVCYAPMVAHALMGEAVRRTDPQRRSFRQIAHEDLFAPLKMDSTSFGVRKDLKPRHRPAVLLETTILPPHPGHSNLGRNGAMDEEFGEMPWVGAISTTGDMFRFCEMLRCGGELDGVRILGPAILDLATRNRTGNMVNNLYGQLAVRRGWQTYPATIGLGFFLRGEEIHPHQFGTTSSPRTFGGNGFGSTVYWVDPARDLTFVCLTSGVMDEGDNIERFQRLSDIALSAAF